MSEVKPDEMQKTVGLNSATRPTELFPGAEGKLGTFIDSIELVMYDVTIEDITFIEVAQNGNRKT